MIKFSRPTVTGDEIELISKAILSDKLSGGSGYARNCESMLEKISGTKKAFLMPSGTAALEIAALLAGVGAGDEVIMPSFTFSSSANAFVLRGATIVFVDIDPGTMNINVKALENAITDKTKAVLIMHYGGVGCDMDPIIELTKKHGLILIEDAAQAIDAKYNGQFLGSFGQLACFSFHDTKNITSGGEGGALLINDETLIERAEIIIEKGTNRSRFMKGLVDKYTWYDVGSSFLMSEIQAAYLNAQLLKIDTIMSERRTVWNQYATGLKHLEDKGFIKLPVVPENRQHNGHIFFIKAKDISERDRLLEYMRSKEVQCTFHYIPLHSSPAGMKFGCFSGEDIYTTIESGRLLRLPVWFRIKQEEVSYVIKCIEEFYQK